MLCSRILSLVLAAVAFDFADGAPLQDDLTSAQNERISSSEDEHTNLLQQRQQSLREKTLSNESTPTSAGFALPFAYSIMGPQGSLVARLIVPLTEKCPEELTLRVGWRKTKIPAVVRAEPAVGHGLFYLEGQVYDTMEGMNWSVASPHPAFDFADRVCEARIHASDLVSPEPCAAYFKVVGQRLNVPLPAADPDQFVVLGDTGLRVKSTNDGWCDVPLTSPKTLYAGKTCPDANLTAQYEPTKVDGMYQRVNDDIDPAKNGWPYNKVAAAASAEVARARGKAVVVHVGDFTYRHEACPFPFPVDLTPEQQEIQRTFGDCQGVGSKWGDTSVGWEADFFEPSAPLLLAAPWIVFRGNHEICGRGGMGWFRYMDPRPANGSLFQGAQTQYPWCVTETPPYAVDFAKDQWLVFDSSEIPGEDVSVDAYPEQAFTEEDAQNAANGDVPPASQTCEDEDSGAPSEWIAKGVEPLVQPGKRHWIGTHRPFFTLAFEKEGTGDLPSRLYSFQCELVNAFSRVGVIIEDVPAIVSGHIHFFQYIQYQERVPQIAFGNGGTQLKTPLNGQPIGLDKVASHNITLLGDLITKSPTVGEFGYGVLTTYADKSPTMAAKFLSDASYKGARDVTASLPPRTFSMGQGWRGSSSPAASWNQPPPTAAAKSAAALAQA